MYPQPVVHKSAHHTKYRANFCRLEEFDIDHLLSVNLNKPISMETPMEFISAYR